MPDRLKKRIGADGETRTPTGVSPPPPQGGVSTNFTTSANLLTLTAPVFLTLAHHQLTHQHRVRLWLARILPQLVHLDQGLRSFP